jgi:hypothetical protein
LGHATRCYRAELALTDRRYAITPYEPQSGPRLLLYECS